MSGDRISDDTLRAFALGMRVTWQQAQAIGNELLAFRRAAAAVSGVQPETRNDGREIGMCGKPAPGSEPLALCHRLDGHDGPHKTFRGGWPPQGQAFGWIDPRPFVVQPAADNEERAISPRELADLMKDVPIWCYCYDSPEPETWTFLDEWHLTVHDRDEEQL